MLSRLAISSAVLLALLVSPANAAERDYLQRGEEKRTADYAIKYDRAVRYVLGRGWQKDVVLRMFPVPAFQPEFVSGIARTASGYTAFEATVSNNIWYQLGFGSEEWKRKYTNYRHIKPILHERRLSDALAVRIAAIWRHVRRPPQLWERRKCLCRHRSVSLLFGIRPTRAPKCPHGRVGVHTERLVETGARSRAMPASS